MSEDDEVREAEQADELTLDEGSAENVCDTADAPGAEQADEAEVDACVVEAEAEEAAVEDAIGAAATDAESEAAAAKAAADDAAPAASSAARAARRRRLMVAVLCLALFAVALGSQTLSFLVRDYPAAGRLAFDGVALDALITTHDAKGEEVPAKSEDEIPLGTVGLDRTVRFKNTGAQTLWVRARAEFSLSSGGERHGLADLTAFDVNGDDWVERDGWFYLVEPLEPGAVSPALITGLTVDTQAAHDRYGSGSYQLDAHAGAVQRKHNADSVLDAEGWPE